MSLLSAVALLENEGWHPGNCLTEELNADVSFSKQTSTGMKITIPCYVEGAKNMQSKYIYRKKPCSFSVPEKSNICGGMTLASC